MPDSATQQATTTVDVTARPLWRISDVSAFLGVPVATLYQWRHLGVGPKAYRLGKHLRYRQADVRPGSRSRWRDDVGSVAKRPDGRWRARYRDPSGNEHARHFDRTLDAQRWIACVEVAVGRGEWLDPTLGTVTVGDWAKQWLDAQVQLKPSTRERYALSIRRFVVPAWGARPISAVGHGDVVRWIQQLSASDLAPATVRHAHRVVSMMFDLAVGDGRVGRNPARDVRLPRVVAAEKRFLTGEQVERLARASGQYEPLVRFLSYTGLRWGEVAALRWRNVDLDRRRVHVVQAMTEIRGRVVLGTPKNHQRRTVPVPAYLARDLQVAAAGRGPDDLAFPAPEGGHLRNGSFRSRFFRQAAASVGLDGLTPHELRHTAASLAIASGANVKAVQRMLGHASAAMTLDVYAGLFADDLDAVAEGLDKAWSAMNADHVRTDAANGSPAQRVDQDLGSPDQGVLVEPPIGVEPMTYALRVRRSTD